MTSTDPQIELQKLIWDILVADTAVMGLANDVYDAVPPDPWGAKKAYVSFGPADVVEDDAECITAGIHTVQIDCWSRHVGSVHCKRLTDACYAALHLTDQQLAVNGLGEMRVTLRMVMRDPDGLTTHGLLQVQAQVEEVGA